jgi:predicted ATPase
MNGNPAAEQGEGESRRSVVLATGVSGSGKSTVLAELGRRGHRVTDTDDPGWIVVTQTARRARAGLGPRPDQGADR